MCIRDSYYSYYYYYYYYYYCYYYYYYYYYYCTRLRLRLRLRWLGVVVEVLQRTPLRTLWKIDSSSILPFAAT